MTLREMFGKDIGLGDDAESGISIYCYKDKYIKWLEEKLTKCPHHTKRCGVDLRSGLLVIACTLCGEVLKDELDVCKHYSQIGLPGTRIVCRDCGKTIKE